MKPCGNIRQCYTGGKWKSVNWMHSMSFGRYFLPLILLFLSLTSCMITNSVRTTQIEIMKPGIIDIPENHQNVAVFNRDIFQSDTCIFKYYKGTKQVIDPNISYCDLSKTCTNAFASSLKGKDYFQRITNYSDSLKDLLTKPDILAHPHELFEKTNSDVCIFLDYFHFRHTNLGDFSKSLHIQAALIWTITFKSDTTAYIYNQVDTLLFDEDYFLNYRSVKINEVGKLMKISAEFLGNSFATKLVPTWITVDRIYYNSSQANMLLAEKYALNNDWPKAAELWNKETKNKNLKIAAKARFNMALACEMAGNNDMATDWLIKSYSCLNNNSDDHKLNCKWYINLLAARKEEIEQLANQVKRQ
ncbi:MAG TPA: DUF6340 family protein [Prolixibacteraceae bacterium]